MDTLEQQIAALIEQHGAEAFIEAVKSHNVQPDSGTQSCPTGYYFNGTQCVLNVG